MKKQLIFILSLLPILSIAQKDGTVERCPDCKAAMIQDRVSKQSSLYEQLAILNIIEEHTFKQLKKELEEGGETSLNNFIGLTHIIYECKNQF